MDVARSIRCSAWRRSPTRTRQPSSARPVARSCSRDLTSLPVGRGGRSQLATRRRRLVLAVAILALAAIATAATWVVLSKGRARETTSVECVIKGVDTIIPSTSGDPAHDCTVEWKREFGSAPPLVAYDNELGGVTVLPRSATPPAGWRTIHSQDVALIELQDSLDDYVNGLNSSCLGNAGATNLTESKLAQFGFTGWTVSSREASSPGTAPPAQAGTRTAPRSSPTEAPAGTATWSTRARRASRSSRHPTRTGGRRPASPTSCGPSRRAASPCRPPSRRCVLRRAISASRSRPRPTS